MALKTALLITGDASGAIKAVEQLATSTDQLTTSSRTSAQAITAVDRAQDAGAASARAFAAATTESATAVTTLGTASSASGGGLSAVTTGMVAQAGAVDGATRRLKGHTQAANDDTAASARHAAGVRNLGQQFGDMAVMIQGGIDPARAFATQAGQMGYAMSEMQGKAGAVGAFLVGPWGIALTVAVAALAPLVQELFKTGEAARAAELATSGLGDAESTLADIFGKTSSKIAEQNELLRINARIKAINLRAEAAQDARDAAKVFRDAGAPGMVGGALRAANTVLGGQGRLLDYFGIGTGSKDAFKLAERARQADTITDPKVRTRAFDQILKDSAKADFSGSGIDQTGFQEAISKRAASRANERIADLLDQSLDAGKINPLLVKPGTTKKPPKPKSTAARDEFGRDAGDRIANITSQFDSTPPLVRQIAQAGRQLDDLMDDLARRKPPGFEKLIADAKDAKVAIQAGINKPLDEFLDAQGEQLRQGQMIIDGRGLEAEAAAKIVAIERQRGPLNAQQRADVLATVSALKGQERQLERVRAVQQVNLNAVRDMQQIVTQTIYEGPKSLAELPARLLESFKRNMADKITEEWFGELFRDARDKAQGAGKVDAASNTIVSAFAKTASAASTLSTALTNAANGGVTPAGAAGAVKGAANDNEDIVVTAKRQSNVYGDTIAGVLQKVGIGKNTATDIGKNAGKALAGAMEGQAAAGVANLLGIKTSGTGAAIGGAVGSFLPIPGGSFIGGALGGIVGGLFGGKKNYGTATVTNNTDTFTGTGNDKGASKAATGLAGAVQDGIAQIAEQLGGQLGNYLVSIGTYDGDYRVSTSGQTGELSFGKKNKSKSTLHDFGDDQAGAIAFAIADAVKDGAVTGLSAAVAKALQSSTDLNKSIKEALAVADVETMLGGLSATYQKAFKDFENTAKERVRIAQQYGFDVIAIEKRNAEDRAKLSEQLLRAQVGSLQSLVTELTSGSLFEGTAMDQIAAINTAIAKAKADLDNGVEGAADTLAGLYQQRLEAAKNAYGSTTGYADTRNATLNEAQAAIASVNKKIVEAGGSDPALATTNASLATANSTLDEIADQNARIATAMEENNRILAGANPIGGTYVPGTLDTRQLAKY